VGLILQYFGGFGAVLGFFAVCAALFVLATLLIGLDGEREVSNG
jgi:ACS family D-galactonate transporter-like MFS transporter